MFSKTHILYTLFVLSIFSCQQQDNTKESATATKEADELTKYWFHLDKKQANTSEGHYEWTFEIERPMKYDIQLLFEDSIATNYTATMTYQEQKQSQKLTQKYTTQLNAQTPNVAQFKKPITIATVGAHSISITTDAPFAEVRLVPNHKSYFGSGKYTQAWEEMHTSKAKQEALAWFNQAKFGMFIHWGLYSQAGGVWKGVKMEDSPYGGPAVAEWLMFKFKISREEYKKLAQTFDPDPSFAKVIARLAKEAGMKYVVITSKHHDGFALFDSKCSDYDMVDATPYHADALKELYDACLAEGLDFGVYYSHGNDWAHGSDGNYANIKKRNDSLGIYTHVNGKNTWDSSPNTHQEYIDNKAMPQVRELLTLLPQLKLIWFDGTGFLNEKQAFEFYKMVYDINPSVLLNRRVGADFGDYMDFGDNVIPSKQNQGAKQWETCGTTNNSWGYKSYDHHWKSTKELLFWFIDIASKGGNYLLNIGPEGSGKVPEKSAEGLKEIGQWLAINGEAIYGSSAWDVFHEGIEETSIAGTGHREKKGFTKKFSQEEFWFTKKENNLYAISLMPSSQEILIKSWHQGIGQIKDIKILGQQQNIQWKQTDKGLSISLKKAIANDNGFVVKAVF